MADRRAAWLLRAVPALVATCAAPPEARAQHWLLLEARDLPAQCTRPMACMDRSTLALRGLLSVTSAERNTLISTLNGMSAVRGLPDEPLGQSVIVPEAMIPVLHPLTRAARLDLLAGHPGVFFDTGALDAEEDTAHFSPMVISELTAAGVRFLTEEEMEATPGRPRLSVNYNARSESAGCIIPFSVTMSIVEETVMVRNPGLKTSGSTWSAQVKENLANRNFTPENALREAVEAFVTDWTAANP